MLALADVAAFPLPGMTGPTAVAFTPDDAALSYLRSPDRSLVRQLYRLDLAGRTGDAPAETLLVTPPGGGITEDNLSLEEKLQRERQRVRELGITSYAWSKLGARLMIPLTGEIFAQQGEQGPLARVVAAAGKPALAPQLSRDGRKIAYVQDAELYVVDADGGTPSQRTSGARGTGKHTATRMLDFDFPVGHTTRARTRIHIASDLRIAIKGGNDVAGRLGIGRSPAARAYKIGLRHAAVTGYVLGMFQPGDCGFQMFAIADRLSSRGCPLIFIRLIPTLKLFKRHYISYESTQERHLRKPATVARKPSKKRKCRV